MPLLNKIKTGVGRITQFIGGVGNNQPTRATDVNPIIDWINNRVDATTLLNTVTSSGGSAAAQTGTLNTISGTITSATLTNTINLKSTITITNAYCTANSTVLAVMSGATVGTGALFIQSVVPSAGSFVITLSNHTALTGTASIIIKFIIL